MDSLRIAINAQMRANGGAGGVQTVLIALIDALGKLDGPEEYVIVGPQQDREWLQPYLSLNQTLVSRPISEPVDYPQTVWWKQIAKKMMWPLVRHIQYQISLPPLFTWPDLPVSDGFYESLGCQVIHFPYQDFVLCALPSIYNPHDLQHLHYPQFFSVEQIKWREIIYPKACHFARKVVVASNWIKEDVIAQYGLPPTKIQIIPWFPPTQAYAPVSSEFITNVRQQYQLPDEFGLYPAATWAHKNHLSLLKALAKLRRQGVTLNLVCTGAKILPHWNIIETKMQEWQLQDQVQFLGYVPEDTLQAVYHLAQYVVIPTLFEAASAPIFEAWRQEKPVACSTVTSLPEQVGDAALLFDPNSVDEIATVLHQIAIDSKLRLTLQKKGVYRLQDFSGERTAKAYRAVYREVAKTPLTEEDRWLLSWDWMKNSKHSNLEVKANE